jgi:predicted transcriptional regulator
MINTLSSSFISSIVERMSELEVTQKELARRMNVSGPYIHKVLNHDVNISFSTASKLATALGLDFQPVLRIPSPRERPAHQKAQKC